MTAEVVAAIRAPDENVYVAPFNLVRESGSAPLTPQIELVILPLEFFMSREAYARLNRWLMTVIFAPALVVCPSRSARCAC